MKNLEEKFNKTLSLQKKNGLNGNVAKLKTGRESMIIYNMYNIISAGSKNVKKYGYQRDIEIDDGDGNIIENKRQMSQQK